MGLYGNLTVYFPLMEPHVFHADIKRSEVEDIFQLASDWIKFAQKNVNKSKAVTLLGSLL